ncbi:MAG: hypothetical protein JNL33_16025 [Betaproteobacteria bacterium]|nr:hypothetical protein [Betaproteobacteria bacterium]MBL8535355.1 hypothetical protein [Betaproteobacteria bacterium]
MEIRVDDHEVVRVHKPFHLIDCESYERWYRRREGVPLANGFYVVTWPADDTKRRFDENANFIGPFRSRAEAEACRPVLEH